MIDFQLFKIDSKMTYFLWASNLESVYNDDQKINPDQNFAISKAKPIF